MVFNDWVRYKVTTTYYVSVISITAERPLLEEATYPL